MNQSTIDDIKGDAFAYAAGMPFTASSYLTYTEEERNCWEDGVLEAIEFLGLEPLKEFDVGTGTDGDQEMDLNTTPYGWKSVEGGACMDLPRNLR